MKTQIRAAALLSLVALVGLAGCDQTAKQAAEHRKKGNTAFKNEQWREAATEYDASLKADPQQEKIWQKKAISHAKLREMDQAVEALKKTLDFKTEPAERAEVYRNIGNMFVQMGPIERAEEFFLEALKIDPKDEAAMSWLAEMFSQMGGARAQAAPADPKHLDKALAYYDQWIAMNPNATNAYLNKRIAYIKYTTYLTDEKTKAEAEAVEKKGDAEAVAAAQARATAAQAKFDELKVKFDENNKALAEASKRNPPQPAPPAKK